MDKRHAKALATLDSKIEELGAKRAALERSFAADREKLSAERDAI
ncbi:hypothetical protein [Sphingomonas sp. HDW15A]|nr:hypothetical protein [Sphingomonas sp. HDW15A]